jgi:hypothetical protein
MSCGHFLWFLRCFSIKVLDQTAQHLLALDVRKPERAVGRSRQGRPGWNPEPVGRVGTQAVVVTGILGDKLVQVPCSQHDEAVQHSSFMVRMDPIEWAQWVMPQLHPWRKRHVRGGCARNSTGIRINPRIAKPAPQPGHRRPDPLAAY